MPGQAIGWTIVVASVGSSDASGVQVSDVVDPSVTGVTVTSSQGGCTALPCTLGTIAAGASATVNVTGALPASSALLTLTNTATATSTTPGTPHSSTTTTRRASGCLLREQDQ